MATIQVKGSNGSTATVVTGKPATFKVDGIMRGLPGKDGKDGLNGSNGVNGQNAVGLPAGGAPSQIPLKSTSADYDIVWSDLQSALRLVDANGVVWYLTITTGGALVTNNIVPGSPYVLGNVFGTLTLA